MMTIKKLLMALLLISVGLAPVACSKQMAPPSPVPSTTAPAPSVPPLGASPGTKGAANDDIVFPPGGFAYRANVHQQGQSDWPSVEQTQTTLERFSSIANITYRSRIETRLGETRNNIFYLKVIGTLDPLKATYVPVGLPEGFTVVRGDEMYGGIGGQDRQASRVVMKISVGEHVLPGEYSFQLTVTVDGVEFGNLPCSVKISS